MRRPVTTLFLSSLLLVAGAASVLNAEPESKTFTSKEYNFEISMPPESIDWEWVKLSKDDRNAGCVVRMETIWKAADTPSTSTVSVFATKASRPLAKKSAESIAKMWGENFEASMENPRDRKAETMKLAAGDGKTVEAWSNDVLGNNKLDASIWRLRYILAKNGKYIYTIMIQRTGRLVDDEDLDEELAQIIQSFKFHSVQRTRAHKEAKKGDAPRAGGSGGASGIDPEKVKREKIELDFWRLHCVKPQGLERIDPKTFSDHEKHYNLVLKFKGSKPQTDLWIRVYVKSTKGSGSYSIDQLVKSRIKEFEKTYDENRRQPPEVNRWRVRGAKKAVHLRTVGRRKVVEVKNVYFMDHRNDRQYTIEMYTTGGTGSGPWKDVMEEFLEHFEPQR